MSEHTALRTTVDRLSGRLRSLPQRRLLAGAAAEGLELARWLAREAEALEFPGRAPHFLPDDGVFAVGDQLAVAGHDFALALDGAGSGQADPLAAEALSRLARAARAIG